MNWLVSIAETFKGSLLKLNAFDRLSMMRTIGKKTGFSIRG